MLFIFLFALTASAVKCSDLIPNGVYTPEEIFECIESVESTVEYNEELVTVLKTLFESYVYKDILKNPPQPSFDSNYHKIVDIDERLSSIDTSNTKLYKLYQQITQIVFDTHDLHLAIQLNSNENYTFYFDSTYYYLPFNILIEPDQKCFVTPQITTKNVTIPEIFGKNEKVEVKSIDGMSVRNWIRKFADEKTALKSPHGRFTYALESFNYGILTSNPFDKEFLAKDIVIEWINGETVTVNYQMIYIPTTSLTESSKIALQLRREGQIFSPLKLKDTITFADVKAKEEEIDAAFAVETSVFDIESDDKTLGCKTYSDKKINLMVLKTFYPTTDTLKWFRKMNKCIDQFDENDYPITVIVPLNGGGMLDLEGNIENVLNIHADTSIIGSVRISEGSRKCLKLAYGSLMADPETCEVRYNSTILQNETLGEWYTNPIVDHYGNVEHQRSHPSVIPPRTFVSSRLTKHPRKPTDIVVFTDAFCYSACSLLTKGLRERGNAIIAGYEGDPELDPIQFDAGQSPTAVISSLYTVTDDSLRLKRLGGVMTISFYESYRYKYDYAETIPREFLTDPIDERVNIYRYEETNIDAFADKALEIVEKYQTECDVNNLRLVKYAEECDGKIGIEHAHGGYVCGSDGKWTSTCVAAYCDTGYKFDYENQKCIYDPCFPPEEESSKPIQPSETSIEEQSEENTEMNMWIIGGCSIAAVVLIILLLTVGIILINYVYKKNKNQGYGILE